MEIKEYITKYKNETISDLADISGDDEMLEQIAWLEGIIYACEKILDNI